MTNTILTPEQLEMLSKVFALPQADESENVLVSIANAAYEAEFDRIKKGDDE